LDRGLFYWPNLSGEIQLFKKEEEEGLQFTKRNFFAIFSLCGTQTLDLEIVR
jgi:hypothetical protein